MTDIVSVLILIFNSKINAIFKLLCLFLFQQLWISSEILYYFYRVVLYYIVNKSTFNFLCTVFTAYVSIIYILKAFLSSLIYVIVLIATNRMRLCIRMYTCKTR